MIKKQIFYNSPEVSETELEAKTVLCLSNYIPEAESEDLEDLDSFDALW